MQYADHHYGYYDNPSGHRRPHPLPALRQAIGASLIETVRDAAEALGSP
jgi:hypothetical protein